MTVQMDFDQICGSLGATRKGSEQRASCPICGDGHPMTISPGHTQPAVFKCWNCEHKSEDIHEWAKDNVSGYWFKKEAPARTEAHATSNNVTSDNTPGGDPVKVFEQAQRKKEAIAAADAETMRADAEALAAGYGLTWADYEAAGCSIKQASFTVAQNQWEAMPAIVYPVLLSDGVSRRTKARSITRIDGKRLAKHGGRVPDKWTGAKCGLFPIDAPGGNTVIDVVGGEDKALLLRKLGYTAYSYTGGEGTLPADVCRLLLSFGVQFRITFDPESHSNAEQSARVLLAESLASNIAGGVQVHVTKWSKAAQRGYDLNDLHRDGGADAVRLLLDAAPLFVMERATAMLSGDAAVNRTTIIRLLMADETVYRRGDALVWLNGSTTYPFETSTLWARMADNAEWLAQSKKGECSPAKPPRPECESVVKSPAPTALRELRGVLSVPLIRADGTIHQVSGYDAETGYVLDSAETWHIPTAPDTDMIRDLVAQFPFVDEGAMAGWLCYVLTMLCPYLPKSGDVPAFAFEASARGAGKGNLVHIGSILATGREAKGEALVPMDSEIQKGLVSHHLAGTPHLHFDEVPDVVNSKSLCALLTSKGLFTGRILGVSKNTKGYWRPIITFCGNNTEFGGDMDRRVLLIRLEPDCETPEDQSFKIADILGHVRQHRKALVENCLAIVHQFILAGCPQPDANVWQSFPQWWSLFRGAVMYAGFADPDSRELVRESATDTTRASLAVILEWLHTQPEPRTAKQIIWHAGNSSELEAAVRDFCETPDGAEVSPRALGKRLKKRKGATVAGLKLNVKPARNVEAFSAAAIVRNVGLSVSSVSLSSPNRQTDLKRDLENTNLSINPFHYSTDHGKPTQTDKPTQPPPAPPNPDTCPRCKKPIHGTGWNGACSVECAAAIARGEAEVNA